MSASYNICKEKWITQMSYVNNDPYVGDMYYFI